MDQSKSNHTDNTKRLRHDSTSDSPHPLKHPRLHANSADFHRDFLNLLNDPENASDRDHPVHVQDLDSVIKSFEEEILAPSPNPNLPPPQPEVFKPNLGYLLEASDDELGLPPTVSPPEEASSNPETLDFARFGPDGVDLTGFLGFEDDIRSYEAFGFVDCDDLQDNGGGYVTIDGLFDYAEPVADILWRSESLQAM